MENLEKEILDLCITLIKIPSISDDLDSLYKIIRFVHEYFEGTNLNIRYYERNGKPSIVVSNSDGFDFDVVLNGHLDVVPPFESSDFEPKIKDGKLYARGAGDMKDGIAIMMILMKNLDKIGYKDKKIGLIMTCDEELGGFDGAGYLTRDLGYKSDVVLIPDAGNLKSSVYAEKGIFQFAFECRGKTAHASMRREGDSAMDKTIAFYHELKNKVEEPNLLNEENQYWSSTVNLTNLVCGTGTTNMIPDIAKGKIDLRFTQKWEMDNLISEVKKTAEKYDVKIDILGVGDLLYSDPKNKHLQKYKVIADDIIGDVNFIKEHGASDGRFFADSGAVIIFQKPTSYNIHAKGEYTEINGFVPIYKIFEKFILS